MKRIFLSIMVAASLVACNTTEKVAVDRNANTQNPIMPIVFSGGDDFTQTIYLTDYLPQVKCFDSLVFTTEPSYQVLKVEEGIGTTISSKIDKFVVEFSYKCIYKKVQFIVISRSLLCQDMI